MRKMSRLHQHGWTWHLFNRRHYPIRSRTRTRIRRLAEFATDRLVCTMGRFDVHLLGDGREEAGLPFGLACEESRCTAGCEVED